MEELLAEKYIVTGQVGNGGSGSVYRVWDRNLERYMAVKEMESTGTWELEREILKELRHPALPVVTDSFEEDGKKYLVMDYIEGMTLLQYLEKYGRVRQEQAVAFTKELAEVLLYLHRQRIPIIYRDMKPSNIMIDETGKVRLIDFGAVYFKYGNGGRPCVRAGTFGYAAPEQLSEKLWDRTDERSDIYGLGATLHHMLTGKNPAKPPYTKEPVRSYDRSLSAELEKIACKALMTEREKRYENAGQLLSDLERLEERVKRKRSGRRIMETLYYIALFLAATGFTAAYYRAELYQYEVTRRALWEERMLMAGFAVFALCMGKWMLERLFCYKRRRQIRTHKSIYLSEKKNAGLPLLFLAAALSVFLFQIKAGAVAPEEPLSVTVKDEYGRKLLLRHDAVYPAGNGLRLFLPSENFEKGKTYTLRLECTEEESQGRRSRIFYLEGQAEKEEMLREGVTDGEP